jgi:hypothetical protein
MALNSINFVIFAQSGEFDCWVYKADILILQPLSEYTPNYRLLLPFSIASRQGAINKKTRPRGNGQRRNALSRRVHFRVIT